MNFQVILCGMCRKEKSGICGLTQMFGQKIRMLFCRFDGKIFMTIQADTYNGQTIKYNYTKDELFAGYSYTGKSMAKI